MTVTRERKTLLAGFGVLVLTALLVGTAVLADRKNAPQSDWLMVMKAEQAQFVEATDGTYTLTLTDVDPVTLAFTDRPERTAQTWTPPSSSITGKASSTVTHPTPPSRPMECGSPSRSAIHASG